MDGHIKTRLHFKLFSVILISLFLLASCSKGNVEMPENVCTLTSEQAPEIRGIKLGMSYDEISERFRVKCNPKVINYDPKSLLNKKVRYSIGIIDVDFHNKTAVYNVDKNYDLKGLDTGCFSHLSETIIGFNPSKFPELEGIHSLRLSFDERKLLVGTNVNYALKHKNEKFTFQELTDSLGLSKWTNWYIELERGGGMRDMKMSRGTLLCNDLVIEPRIDYFLDYGNAYSVRLEISSITHDELLFIKKANEDALKDEEQKKRDEVETSNPERKKRMEEENKVREPFKP